MPLNFTDQIGSSENFETLLEAFDGDKRIVVVSSQEAIEDHGLSSVQNKASEKYDAKQYDDNGRITVLTRDL